MTDEIFFENKKNKNYRFKKTVDTSWVESGFDHLAAKNEKSIFLGKTLSPKKFIIIKFLIISWLFFLLTASFSLQIIAGAKYREIAETNRIRQIPIIASRGILYDRNERPLVSNTANFYAALIPADLPKNDQERTVLIEKIAGILNISAGEIEERLSFFRTYNYQLILIKNNISYEEAARLEVLNNTYPAIQIDVGFKRKYDHPTSLSHLIGFLGKLTKEDLKKKSDYLLTDNLGKAGIELVYEDKLRGVYGKKQVEVDALGRQKNVLTKDNALPGEDLILTIDNDLQGKVEEIFAKHLRAYGKERGVVIISYVLSGEILALVSLPAFDNNLFAGNLDAKKYESLFNNKNKPLFNRAISGEYPPGSTIKPLLAASALEENIVKEPTSFISSGGIRVNQWFFPDWRVGGHGPTNVRLALAESVNTFFYIIGGGLLDKTLNNFIFNGLGLEKIVSYAKKFGLGNILGIDLPGESAGFLPTKKWKEEIKKESWYIGDTYHLSIGQGDILVTPLQVNFLTAFFANGGILYKPQIVKIIKKEGMIENLAPQILNTNFIQKENIAIVKAGLRDAVIYGSSRALSDLPVALAGKTGTAQWSKTKAPHAWFTGFAPYDAPEIAITVLVEEGGEGSKIAVPVAKEILWWYFTYIKN